MMTKEKVSRTRKKKAAQALQKLGEQLVCVNDAQFNSMELPEELMEAVAMARHMNSHEAKRRQLQYIGRLMREYDPADVQNALDKIEAGQAEKKRQFKLAERWRDELVAGSEERLAWISTRYPSIDAEELAGLVHNARGKRPGVNSKTAGRMLFRFLIRILAN